MANIKSQKKRVITNEKARQRNQAVKTGAHEWVVILVTLTAVLGVRLLSLKRGWSLPVYEYDEEAAAAYDPRDALTTFLYQRARRIPGARTAYRGLRKMRLPPRSEHRRPEN